MRTRCRGLAGMLAAMVAVLAVGGTVRAQESRGAIEGSVTDASGAVLPGVTVTIVNTATGVSTSAVTNERGSFVVPFLTSGTYDVSAEVEGFRKAQRRGVQIRVADRVELNFTLEVGSVSEAVDVTTATPLLETRTASAGQVISQQQFEFMPLPDGNPMMLTRLAPGIVHGPAGKFYRPFDNGGTSDLTADGAPGANEFTLDGSPNMSEPGEVAYVPPAGSVQEVKVETATFDAQQGHTAGATINTVTKSGTNVLQGDGYYQLRDRSLTANDFFLERAGEPKPERNYDRLGFTLGGPLLVPGVYSGRSRTFFFTAAEWYDEDVPEAGQFTVPTEAQRNGDLSALLDQGIQISDPATAFVNENGRVERRPFPGNVIPQDRINPIARQVLSFYPLPNQTGDAQGLNNFSSTNVTTEDFYSALVRVDHQLSPNHKMFGRYARNKRTNGSGNWTGEVNGVRPSGSFLFRTNDAITLDHVWTMSSSSLLNIRGGWVRFQEPRLRPSDGIFAPASLGFSPEVVQLFGGVQNFPLFDFAGFDELGGEVLRGLTTQILSAQPVWTRISGNHTFRTGYDLRVFRQEGRPDSNPTGLYYFDSCFTNQSDTSASAPIGQDLTGLLLGIPCSGQIDRVADRFNQQLYHGVFVQDDWKVNDKLTLNLGLRYEYEGAPTERHNRNVRGFAPDANLAITSAAEAAFAANPIAEVAPADFRVLGGLQFADASNRTFYNADSNNVQPRVGMAYQVNEKTVLRSGWAIYSVPRLFEGIQQSGFSQTTDLVPSFDNGLTFQATLDNPFPSGVLDPPGASLGPDTFVGQGLDTVMPLDVRNGQAMRWTASVQRQLWGRWVAEAAYVGNHGYDLATDIALNPVPARLLSTSAQRDDAVIDHITERVVNPFAGLAPGTPLDGETIDRAQLLRPFPQFQDIESRAFDGSSDYAALQLRLERRFSEGFSVLTSYTFSNFTETLWRMNPTDPEPTTVSAANDVPHRFVLNWVAELPFGRGRRFASSAGPLLDALIGGWSVSGMWQWQVERPLELEDDVFYNGDITELETSSSDNVDVPAFDTSGFFFEDEQVRTNGELDPIKQRNDPRIDLEYHLRTVPLRTDNLRRQSLNLWELSFVKRFTLGATLRGQLDLQLFNAFNYVSFNPPELDSQNSDFGKVLSQSNLPRTLQVGFKVLF
ncbi:MAG: TonB-dependent receptor domain-containing protein [Vicinamibacteraceae bacterium]